MPDYLKISELPAASSVAPTDQIELNQSGTSRSATIGLSVGVYQTVSTVTGAVATGTTLIPHDDTIPQNTEGTEFMTLAITPKSATSKLVIDVTAYLSNSVGNNNHIAALFRDSTANALAVGVKTEANAGFMLGVSFRHVVTSGSTSATTFRVRCGCNLAGTTTLNGTGGARSFGGVFASTIIIQEVAP